MTFTSKVNNFKKAATWLDPNLHGPALEVLAYCAKALDTGNGTNTMAMCLRQTWSALMADRPKDAAPEDEVDALITGLAL